MHQETLNWGLGQFVMMTGHGSSGMSNLFATYQPSIEYLELYGVLIGVLLWIKKYKNRRVTLFCDNQSVVAMINSNTSSCKNCMILIRILVLECLIQNVKIRAQYISSADNYFLDALSRLKLDKFWDLACKYDRYFKLQPVDIPERLWPMEKIWMN